MGYYTLQVLGYIIDCYWENVIPQKNPFKLFSFCGLFSTAHNPIQLADIVSLRLYMTGINLNIKNIVFGAQRIFGVSLRK